MGTLLSCCKNDNKDGNTFDDKYSKDFKHTKYELIEGIVEQIMTSYDKDNSGELDKKEIKEFIQSTVGIDDNDTVFHTNFELLYRMVD